MAVLKKGSKGKPVEQLQTVLNKKGASPKLKVDGVFGPKTEAGVKAFQKKAKLKADGIAGEISQFALDIGPRPKSMTIENNVFTDGITQSKARNKNFNADVNRLEIRFKKIATETAKLHQLLLQRIKMFSARRVKANKAVNGVYAEWEKKINSLNARYKASRNPTEIKAIRAEAEGMATEFKKKFLATEADETMDTMRQTANDMEQLENAVKKLQGETSKL